MTQQKFNMRLLIILLLILISAVDSIGQSLKKKDSIIIASMIEDWNTAWKSKDHELASKWYSHDARFTNAFGDKKYGRQEINELLKTVFALPFVMSGDSETSEQNFQPAGKNLVLVHTLVSRKGQKMPDGSALAERKTTHLRIFKRNNGSWEIISHLISDARNKQSDKH